MTTKTIKIGDLTLRQLQGIKNRPCPCSSCKECKYIYTIDYNLCCGECEFKFDDAFLDVKIEVEYDDKD